MAERDASSDERAAIPGPNRPGAAGGDANVADDGGRADAANAHAALAADLRAAMEGAVRFDEYARVLYATDGSVYGAEPAGVAIPRHEDDVRAAVRTAAEHGVPVLPRGAGSSLAGQAVGPGCLVLDCSVHVDEVLSVDPEARTATVQPGVVQDDLDDRLAEHGLRFAPDPASSNRATIGGGVGNNSTGAHSVRYGITDAYVESLRVVLADGSLLDARPVVVGSPEWERVVGGGGREADAGCEAGDRGADAGCEAGDREAEIYRTILSAVEDNEAEIAERYPELKRCVSGYNLQKAVYRNADGERVVDPSKLVVGAEGTLGVVVEATLSLVTVPEETALGLYCFEDLLDAMAAVPAALDLDPSAVELIDDRVVEMARESPEYAAYAEPIPEGAAAALMVEFDSELHDDLRAAVEKATERFVSEGAAFEAIAAHAPDEQDRLWKLRKAAIPLLMSMDGDPKPYPFVEDASVPPEHLAEYVAGFREILDAHDTTAAFFAHAGVGTLHIRPVLNLKEESGVERMAAIAEDVTDLVGEFNGAFSGEHGDGLARTQFNPKLYGPDLWDAFKEVKSAFDPDWRMNPGKVVFRDEDPTDVRDHLRYGPAYATVEPQTALDFDEDGGFAHLVELCNGCGTCRQTGSDTMCPTYRATREEVATTRGRANLLRAAISGELDPEELYTERFQSEVLDLCIGCKGCARDCPTGVDLAKLKAEVKHQYHDREGVSLRERLFSNVDRLAAVGSALAPLSNVATRLPNSRWLPGADWLAERALGVAPERDLPPFRRQSLVEWFEGRASPSTVSDPTTNDRRVLLFPDTYTNYSYPGVGKAAVRVLEAAGVDVRVPDLPPTGRAAYSQGRLDLAADRADALLSAVAPRIDAGWDLVFVEPSDAAMVHDEYGALVSNDGGPLSDDGLVDRVAAGAYGLCEYLDRERLVADLPTDAPDESLAYHGHCHQTALGRDHHAVAVLRRAGYAVDPLDTGCCGMAGSFGYEAEHYELSRAIAAIAVEKVEASDAATLVAPGASCRSQFGELRGAGDGGDVADASRSRPPHPAEMLERALERE